MTCTMSPSRGPSQDLNQTVERTHTCTAAHGPLEKQVQQNCELLEARWSVSTGMRSGTPHGPEGLLCARHFHIQFHVSSPAPPHTWSPFPPSLPCGRVTSLRQKRSHRCTPALLSCCFCLQLGAARPPILREPVTHLT